MTTHTIRRKNALLLLLCTALVLATVRGVAQFWDDSSSTTPPTDITTPGSDIFDDSDFPVPPERVQNNYDTTEIDLALKMYYTHIIENKTEYTTITTDDITSRIGQICYYYDDICNKITFKNSATLIEQYTSIVYVTHLIKSIDKNTLLSGVRPLRDTFASLTFTSDENASRGQAGHRNMFINTFKIDTNVELFEVLTHEFGHMFDLGSIDDQLSKAKNSVFTEFGDPAFGINDRSLKFYALSREGEQARNPDASRSHFVSGYGSASPFEEFAEFMNAWTNHHIPLILLARTDPQIMKKYRLFRELFGKRHINSDIPGYHSLDFSTRPYDTTRWVETQGLTP